MGGFRLGWFGFSLGEGTGGGEVGFGLDVCGEVGGFGAEEGELVGWWGLRASGGCGIVRRGWLFGDLVDVVRLCPVRKGEAWGRQLAASIRITGYERRRRHVWSFCVWKTTLVG